MRLIHANADITFRMSNRILERGTSLLRRELIESGMQKPMIQRNEGKIKSGIVAPFHSVWPSHQ